MSSPEEPEEVVAFAKAAFQKYHPAGNWEALHPMLRRDWIRKAGAFLDVIYELQQSALKGNK